VSSSDLFEALFAEGWRADIPPSLLLPLLSLVSISEKARLARPPPPIRKPAPPASSSTGSTPPRQVVIEGVVFEFDASGTKLNKVEGELFLLPPLSHPAPSLRFCFSHLAVYPPCMLTRTCFLSSSSASFSQGQSDSPNPARRRHSLFGQDYVRTKSGNLLSAAIVRSRKGGRGGPSAEEMAGKKERLGNMTLVLNGMQKAR